MSQRIFYAKICRLKFYRKIVKYDKNKLVNLNKSFRHSFKTHKLRQGLQSGNKACKACICADCTKFASLLYLTYTKK